jgi:hypothetical protein
MLWQIIAVVTHVIHVYVVSSKRVVSRLVPSPRPQRSRPRRACQCLHRNQLTRQRFSRLSNGARSATGDDKMPGANTRASSRQDTLSPCLRRTDHVSRQTCALLNASLASASLSCASRNLADRLHTCHVPRVSTPYALPDPSGCMQATLACPHPHASAHAFYRRIGA